MPRLLFLLAAMLAISLGSTAASPRWSGVVQPSLHHTITLSNGFTLRYLRTGEGPPLVLLHTLRTQLDYFEKMVPALEEHYTVYAVDLPGHGGSSILPVEYTEALFRESLREFLERLELRDVTLAGESIGGVLALTVAADSPERVRRVVAINPYDYGERFGGGIRRGSGGWVIGFFEWFGRHTIEPAPLLAIALRGGLVEPTNLSADLLRKFRWSGARVGYRGMEASLFANWESWVAARERYGAVKAPVTLVYSEGDWSHAGERERNRLALNLDHTVTIAGAGHFASLERPQAVLDAVLKR